MESIEKINIKETSTGESSGTGLNSPSKDGYAGVAAFSLASLDQGRSNGSMINLSSFDPAVFFKSSSFDSLHTLLGSQFFKTEVTDKQQPIPPLSMSNSSSNLLNNSGHSLVGILPSISSPVPKNFVPAPISSSVISTLPVSPISSGSMTIASSSSSHPQVTAIQPVHGSYSNAIVQPKDQRIVEKKDENSKFVDVTPFLTLPQHEAAKKLGIPSSTLAKRWKEASCNRKWPYRTVSKLDKEILTLLKNVESAKAELSPSVEATLGLLLKKRNEELKTVLVRL